MKYNTQTPFTASYLIFRDKKGRIACLLRGNTAWMDNHYGLPAGKVEKEESFLACAVREAKEEVNVVIKQSDLRHVLTMHRHEEEENDWVDIFFEATAWQGDLQNAEPHVHSELVWFLPDELPDNMVPNVRYGLEQIARGSVYCEYNWSKT